MHRLESELRLQHTKHDAALADLKMRHQQEREALQAQLESKEREVEAAQEGAEAAQRAVEERDRELAGKMDASADKVGWHGRQPFGGGRRDGSVACMFVDG